MFLSIKFCSLLLYCWVGSIPMELPLSEDVIVASFSVSLVCFDRIVEYLVGLVRLGFVLFWSFIR